MKASERVKSQFESMLPALRRQIRYHTRFLTREEDEIRQTALCLAFDAYLKLADSGRLEKANATALALYSSRQALFGRNLGASLNSDEPLSNYAQRKHGFGTASLLGERAEWKDNCLASERANPAAIVQALMDTAQWFETLAPKLRHVAELLGAGEATSTVAALTGITAGRVSQLRRELADSWARFTGEVS